MKRLNNALWFVLFIIAVLILLGSFKIVILIPVKIGTVIVVLLLLYLLVLGNRRK